MINKYWYSVRKKQLDVLVSYWMHQRIMQYMKKSLTYIKWRSMFEMKMLKGHISVYLTSGVIGFIFRRIGNFLCYHRKFSIFNQSCIFHILWVSNFSIVNNIKTEVFWNTIHDKKRKLFLPCVPFYHL